MKVLVIEDNYATHMEGKYLNGIYRVSKLLNDLLHDKGHEVHSFCPSGGDLKSQGWIIHESTLLPKDWYDEVPWFHHRDYTREFVQLFKTLEPDLVISHGYRAGTMLRGLMKCKEYAEDGLPMLTFDTKIMVVQHGLPVGGPEQYAWAVYSKEFYTRGMHQIAVSEFCKDRWNDQYMDLEMSVDGWPGRPGVPVVESSFCFQFLE